MHDTADRLKRHYESRLDLALDLCGLGFGCCERLTAIQAEWLRDWLAHVDNHREPLRYGEFAEFTVGAGHITTAHWQSALSCGVEFQKGCLERLARHGDGRQKPRKTGAQGR